MKYLFKNEIISYTYLNSNSKQTILFLHGWGGNEFSFFSTINLLKKDFNILAITMPTILPTTLIWNIFDYANLVQNLLNLLSIKKVIIVCHSFGFRVALILQKKIQIEKLVVTGGAGFIKQNIIKKIKNRNNILLLKKDKDFFKKIASSEYQALSPVNRKTFQNIVNFNLKFLIKFTCPILLFWGKKDKVTKLWILKLIKRNNNAQVILTKSDHFAYLKENMKFNHSIIKFIKN